jgi:hypothetical protein
VQKILFASTAIACVMALGSLTSQKVEAAPAMPVAMVQTSPSSLLLVGEWRDRRHHRDHWPFWQHRRHHGNDYDRYDGYRRDGYRYRRNHNDRGLLYQGYRALKDD